MKFYIINFLAVAAFSAPIYLLVRRPWRFRSIRELPLFLYVIYMAALMALVLMGRYTTPVEMLRDAYMRVCVTRYCINYIPLRTVRGLINWGTREEIWINIISNVVVFIPYSFGFLLLWKKTRKPSTCIALCLGLPVCIEFAQLFIGRNADVDDIMLNFAGGIIGALLFAVFRRLFPKSENLAK